MCLLQFCNIEAYYSITQLLANEFKDIIAKGKIHEPWVMECLNHFFSILISQKNLIEAENHEPFGIFIHTVSDLAVGSLMADIFKQASKQNVFKANPIKLVQYSLLYCYETITPDLSQEVIDTGYRELISKIDAIPSYSNFNILKNLKKDDLGIPIKDVFNTWKSLFTMAIKLKKPILKSKHYFEEALNTFVESNIPQKAKTSPEWQQFSINLCNEAFNELCNPQNPLYDDQSHKEMFMMEQVFHWLTSFWNKGCFVDQKVECYNLIEGFINLHPPQYKDSSTCLVKKSKMLIDLVVLVNNKQHLDTKSLAILKSWINKFENRSFDKHSHIKLLNIFTNSLNRTDYDKLCSETPWLKIKPM